MKIWDFRAIMLLLIGGVLVFWSKIMSKHLFCLCWTGGERRVRNAGPAMMGRPFEISKEEKGKMKKRLLAAVMSLCMIVSLLPVSAFALEDEGENPETETCICGTRCTEDNFNEDCTVRGPR